jgi:SAM-dependent methyltransferase
MGTTAKKRNLKVVDQPEGNLEMSKYIDLQAYHAAEKTHPFYLEMIDEIHHQIKVASQNRKNTAILELGAGTGLLTQELIVKHPQHSITALEYDWKIHKLLTHHVEGKAHCVCGDAVTYEAEHPFDILVSSFAHDHIHFDLRHKFSKNIRKNLKPGGRYIMGGEILPYFDSEPKRLESLYTYHLFIINKALKERHFEVAKLEIDALRSGADQIGDFKRHEGMFEEEMSPGFRLVEKKKIGPSQPSDVGGVFVYVFEAI